MSKHLYETSDSHTWAEKFVDTYKSKTVGKEVDITTMINWFANYKSACEKQRKKNEI